MQADDLWSRALDQARSSSDTRKLLLLATAFCYRVWDRLPNEECRNVVSAVEQLADSPLVQSDDYNLVADVDRMVEALMASYGDFDSGDEQTRAAFLATLACGGMWHDPTGMIESVAVSAAISESPQSDVQRWAMVLKSQIAIIEDMIPGKVTPITGPDHWLTPQLSLWAREIYTERRFNDLPKLADLLQSAGCHQYDLLAHCRHSAPHWRGCWALDWLLQN